MNDNAQIQWPVVAGNAFVPYESNVYNFWASQAKADSRGEMVSPVQTPPAEEYIAYVFEGLLNKCFLVVWRMAFKDESIRLEPPKSVAPVRFGMAQSEAPNLVPLAFDMGTYQVTPPNLTAKLVSDAVALPESESQHVTINWHTVEDPSKTVGQRLVMSGVRDPQFIIDAFRSQFWSQEQDLEEKATFILAVEKSQFTNPQVRQAVKSQLRTAAEMLWHTQDRRWEPIVWSAIRRYASMLLRPEVGTLGEFLDWTGAIDARQVTLQAIQNVFAVAPPPTGNEWRDLGDRVFQISKAALRPARLSPGKPAALAMNAVAAVAAVGDERLQECVQTVRAWDQPWFSRQVRHLLRELCALWPAENPAAVQVAKAINALLAE